uniref:PD-(D/E)XK nuclease family protein n=1 Tax=Candidatus Thiosymbion oneisti TaxID=589554 RepID=UPI000AF9EE22
MVIEAVSETLKRELPTLLRDDPDLRRYILDLTRGEYADRQQTGDRFDCMLDELRQDREAQERKWEKQDRKWWEAQAENKRKWEEQDRKWREAREEQDRKWKENRADFERVHEEIMAQAEKYDRRIGALGARWGVQSEATFRNALAGILEKNFDIQVLNVNEYDDQGEVFGRPEQVELDVIVKNGLLLICELKSSIDKGGMYLFERK